MDKVVLCRCLLKWLQTFPDVTYPAQQVEDYTDGVTMAHVLTQIAPEWFTASWLSKINQDAGNNWRLKVSNLRKILEGITEYYAEILGQTLTHMPDINKIGEVNDESNLGILLQLILGCAVNCENKQEYIQVIMGMEESLQTVIMGAIQEIMTRECIGGSSESLLGGQRGSTSPPILPFSMAVQPGVDAQMKQMLQELEREKTEMGHIYKKASQLEIQVSTLTEDKLALVHENERLVERLKDVENPSDTTDRVKQLRAHIEQLREDNDKLEAGKEELRQRSVLYEEQYTDMKSQYEACSQAADKARQLQDELDALREYQERATNAELQLLNYKKKLEDMNILKRQVKLLEDKNNEYMNKSLQLEEELRVCGSWKPQVDMYRKQLGEVRGQLSEESRRADKAEFDSKKYHDKLTSITREKDSLVSERDQLKENIDELKCNQYQTQPTTTIVEDGLEILPPQIREKLARLERDNKRLAEYGNEESAHLKVQIEQLQESEAQLNTDNRLATKRNIELESQLEEMQGASQASGENQDKTIKDLLARLRHTEEECSKRRRNSGDVETKMLQQASQIRLLEETLSRKQEEMCGMEERYKKYIDKAKSIVRSLDPSKAQMQSTDVDTLRKQVHEKDRIIENLERDTERTRAIMESEERLIATAFYNMGMQLDRQAVEQRLAVQSGGQSFLARQRQATGRRVNNSEFYDY